MPPVRVDTEAARSFPPCSSTRADIDHPWHDVGAPASPRPPLPRRRARDVDPSHRPRFNGSMPRPRYGARASRHRVRHRPMAEGRVRTIHRHRIPPTKESLSERERRLEPQRLESSANDCVCGMFRASPFLLHHTREDGTELVNPSCTSRLRPRIFPPRQAPRRAPTVPTCAPTLHDSRSH